MIYLIFYFIGWFIGLLLYLIDPNLGFIKSQLLAQLSFTVSFFGIFNFIGHVFFSKKVAATIGWESNFFQKELGFASLGIGLCGILSFWFKDGFGIATILPLTTFLIGAGSIHILEMIRKKNFNPGNTLIILPDFLIPITLIILMVCDKVINHQ